MAGWHHWLNGYEFEPAPGDSEGQGSDAVSGVRVRHDWATKRPQSTHYRLGRVTRQHQTTCASSPIMSHTGVFSASCEIDTNAASSPHPLDQCSHSAQENSRSCSVSHSQVTLQGSGGWRGECRRGPSATCAPVQGSHTSILVSLPRLHKQLN